MGETVSVASHGGPARELSELSLQDDETSRGFSSQQWGTERHVEIHRIQGQGLGISIVGGKVDPSPKDTPGSAPITGIFIKNVLPGSSADECGQLFPGDRILEVDGHDLREASHDKAVDVIRQTGNTVRFIVQSLLGLSRNESSTNINESSTEASDDDNIMMDGGPNDLEVELTELPPVPPPPGHGDDDDVDSNTNAKQSSQRMEEEPIDMQEEVEEDDDTGDDEDDDILKPEMTGQVTLPNGNVIDKASAAYLKKSSNDDEAEIEEDGFGYTVDKFKENMSKKIKQGCRVIYVSINKGTSGLGISLAGHKDRSQMAVYICGLNPQGNAARDGRMNEGDLILEANGMVLHNRHHLNASAVIKGLPENDNTFVLLRTQTGLDDIAVRPLTQFPPEPHKDNPIERYRGLPGLREVTIEKGDRDWGIMIIEGRHAGIGTGVFISDIQADSCADEAGLARGDLILAVNGEDFVGVSYNTAAKVLKNAQGTVKLIVANPNLTMESLAKEGDSKLAASVASKDPLLPPPEELPPPPPAPADLTEMPASIQKEEEEFEDKPKIAPKPTIAPKPMGLSP